MAIEPIASVKEDFFKKLDRLNDIEDDSVIDEGRLASESFLARARNVTPKLPSALTGGSSRNTSLQQSKKLKALNASRSSRDPPTAQRIHRTTSAPIASTSMDPSTGNDGKNSREQIRPTQVHIPKSNLIASPPKLKHTTSAPPISSKSSAMPSSTAPKSSAKRKRTDETPMVPEAQRIFTGLSLYFFPNSDANKVRKRRIEKAKEYGAVWTKVWSNNVTHVIVDNKMTYQEVTKFLKLDTLPPEIIVVNETYLFDCISYHNLLDPKARYYEVPGMPTSSTVVEVAKLLPSELSSLNSSLPLKPAKNDIQILDTPSASVESGDVHQGQNDPAQDNLLSPANGTPNEPENISFGYNDELSAIMKESQSLKHIPVDLEDEDDTASLANSESDSDDDSKGNPSTKPKKSWQENFQCMDKHDGANTDANPNSETIEILQQMSEFYDRIRDQWRTLAYRKAIASLKKQSQRVIFQEDAVKLPFVGHRIAAKIEEIALTRGLRRLDNAKLDPHDQVLQMFMKIYGVGISQASQWVQQGYRTLKDLEKSAKLSTNQKIGIAHYDDLQLRIPRAEVEHHGAVVRDALRQMDPEFQVTVGGSYRRGALSSGDVDLIITRPGADARSLNISAIGTLVPKLESAGFLVAALAKTSKDTGSKWHGCSKLPTSDVWRRIDLLLVPWDEMGAALIYFTGNDIFNRSIRLLASKKGMRLNQRGLFKDVMRGPGRVKVTDGILLEGRNEKRIFEILGVPWRPPEHRIC